MCHVRQRRQTALSVGMLLRITYWANHTVLVGILRSAELRDHGPVVGVRTLIVVLLNLVPPLFFFWRSARHFFVLWNEGVLKFFYLRFVVNNFSLNLRNESLNTRHDVLSFLGQRVLESLTSFTFTRSTRNLRPTFQFRRYFSWNAVLIKLNFHSLSIRASTYVSLSHFSLLVEFTWLVMSALADVVVVYILLSGVNDRVSCLLMHTCGLRRFDRRDRSHGRASISARVRALSAHSTHRRVLDILLSSSPVSLD